MRGLDRRLAVPESANDTGLRPWHRVIVEDGESKDQAIARYEAERGLLDGDSCFIMRFILPKLPGERNDFLTR